MTDLEQRAVRATTEEIETHLAQLEHWQDLPYAPLGEIEPAAANKDLAAVVLVLDLLGFLGTPF